MTKLARTPLALTVLAAAVALIPGAASAAERRASDESVASGVSATELSRGATVLDFDSDGWDDLLVGRHYRGFPHLYRNDAGGGFTDVHRQAFPAEVSGDRDRHGCTAADVDLDGLVDIYCTTGGKKGGTAPNPNELWLQTEPGRFQRRTAEWHVTDEWGRGRETTFLDANGDRWPDLLVGNTYPRKDGRSGANRLYLNQAGRRFARAGRSWGLDKVVGSNSVETVDLEGDGDEDVAICGPKGVRIYANAGQRRFRDATHALRADLDCAAAGLADVGGDSRPDLIRLSKAGLAVHLRRDGGFGRPVSRERFGGGVDLALGDADGDGVEDAYVLRRGRPDADLRDRMFLIERRGRGLERAWIPQTRQGLGEAVTSIDHDRNGHADFLVQNGHRQAEGPTRLIAFR